MNSQMDFRIMAGFPSTATGMPQNEVCEHQICDDIAKGEAWRFDYTGVSDLMRRESCHQLRKLRYHRLSRCHSLKFERAGVPRTAAMKMVGHKTESIYAGMQYRKKECWETRPATGSFLGGRPAKIKWRTCGKVEAEMELS